MAIVVENIFVWGISPINWTLLNFYWILKRFLWLVVILLWYNLLPNSCNCIRGSFYSYIRVRHAVSALNIPGYNGVLAISELVISEHFNITDPIETACAQQIVWLSRGLVISEVGISGVRLYNNWSHWSHY